MTMTGGFIIQHGSFRGGAHRPPVGVAVAGAADAQAL
jgi:hypothetical protein